MGWRDTVHRIQEPSRGKCGASTDLFLASLINEYRFLNEMFNVARLSAAKTATIDFAAKAGLAENLYRHPATPASAWRRSAPGYRRDAVKRTPPPSVRVPRCGRAA